MGSLEVCLPRVLIWEGGWADHPDDPGGPTMKGVTQRVYDAYRARKGLGKQTVRSITPDELQDLYRGQYWNTIRGDQLPPGLDLATFDFAVNSGPGRAVRHLQAALGVPTDGVMGNVTLAAAQEAFLKHEAHDVINRMEASRLDFLQHLRTWKVFGKGWKRRVDSIGETATLMARAGGPGKETISNAAAMYNPTKEYEPEAARKSKNSSWWAGVAGIGGVLGTSSAPLFELIRGTRSILDGLFPAALIGVILLGVAGAFVYNSYTRSKEAENLGVTTPPPETINVQP